MTLNLCKNYLGCTSQMNVTHQWVLTLQMRTACVGLVEILGRKTWATCLKTFGNMLLPKINGIPGISEWLPFLLWHGVSIRTGDNVWKHLTYRCSTNGNESGFIWYDHGAVFWVSMTQKALLSTKFLLCFEVPGGTWKQTGHIIHALPKPPTHRKDGHKPKEFHYAWVKPTWNDRENFMSMGLVREGSKYLH